MKLYKTRNQKVNGILRQIARTLMCLTIMIIYIIYTSVCFITSGIPKYNSTKILIGIILFTFIIVIVNSIICILNNVSNLIDEDKLNENRL